MMNVATTTAAWGERRCVHPGVRVRFLSHGTCARSAKKMAPAWQETIHSAVMTGAFVSFMIAYTVSMAVNMP